MHWKGSEKKEQKTGIFDFCFSFMGLIEKTTRAAAEF